MSDDGNVVVGTSGYQSPTDAFIWTLVAATCVSPDGKIIAGVGLNSAAQRIEGFIVKLP